MSSCPISHTERTDSKSNCPVEKTGSKSECPANHFGKGSDINPLNQMPAMTNQKQPNQETELGLSRQQSIIKNSENKYWEYPSEQQFYNALARKNKAVPLENVKSMVDIHNFLNDGSWEQILYWEGKYHCDCKNVRLNSFKGRPDDLSPRAWFYSTFMGSKPFDRHDWYVDRCGQEVRYVLDYYGGSSDLEFNVDVRPALDSVGSIKDRMREFWSGLFN